jgi:hypothetical protein
MDATVGVKSEKTRVPTFGTMALISTLSPAKGLRAVQSALKIGVMVKKKGLTVVSP